MSTVRLRRLQSDFERVSRYVAQHPRLQLIQVEGNPPERYQIEYKVKSLRQQGGELREVDSHLVEIALPREYPRNPPYCRMLTPVFHPNIAPHAICIGDHWSAGESLQSLVARIGEILGYQSYNTKSPLNGEAARWTDENVARLPLDAVSMAVEEKAGADAGPPVVKKAPVHLPIPTAPMEGTAPAAPPPLPAQAAAAPREIRCPTCASALRIPANYTGARARCPKCQSVIQLR